MLQRLRRIPIPGTWVNRRQEEGPGLLAPAHSSRIGYFWLEVLLRLGQLVPDVVHHPSGARSTFTFGHTTVLSCSGAPPQQKPPRHSGRRLHQNKTQLFSTPQVYHGAGRSPDMDPSPVGAKDRSYAESCIRTSEDTSPEHLGE